MKGLLWEDPSNPDILRSVKLLARWQVGRRPILVLGHGRSGTTWVGNVLAAARRVLYYFEPLHPNNLGKRDLSNWSHYTRPGTRDVALEDAFDPVFAGLPSSSLDWRRSAWHRLVPGYRVVVKDVATVMSAEWLYKRYRPLVLLVVRHPCAVILSEQEQRTPPERSLELLLRQDDLMEDHLSDYKTELAQVSGVFETLAAVWAARHRVMANGLAKHPEWQVVYYEALCADPLGQYKEIFNRLGLGWSEAIAEHVVRQSSVEIPGQYSARRVSWEQIGKWTGHFSSADVARVRKIVLALGVPFYEKDGEWTLASFLAQSSEKR